MWNGFVNSKEAYTRRCCDTDRVIIDNIIEEIRSYAQKISALRAICSSIYKLQAFKLDTRVLYNHVKRHLAIEHRVSGSSGGNQRNDYHEARTMVKGECKRDRDNEITWENMDRKPDYILGSLCEEILLTYHYSSFIIVN